MSEMIGVVRVPMGQLLCMPPARRQSLSYPEPSREDWRRISSLVASLPPLLQSESSAVRMSQRDEILSSTQCLKVAKSLSFHGFLQERAFSEARQYAEVGMRTILIDFCTGNAMEEPAIYWTARALTECLHDACGEDFKIGIRMDDNGWSADIAGRTGCDFVVCNESWNGGWQATRASNRLLDGTGRKRPKIFWNWHLGEELYDLAGQMPEGVVVSDDGIDEDRMDAFGSELKRMMDKTGMVVEVIGSYHEDISRGEMHGEMTAWGARDYMLVDKEARNNGIPYAAIDLEKLALICGEIEKLK